ncbi:MAG: hypothetical protein AAB362_02620 [Patescibacteria group bacterium]
MTNAKSSAISSQNFVAIDSIRDGIVILKKGGIRAVLMVSSVNFDLKSTTEQDATIFQYQNTINSFDFSVQFIIQSRKLNIEPYLNILLEQYKKEQNELVKIQINEYTDFIKSLVEISNIVSKTFFVVVPYYATDNIEKSAGGVFSSIFGGNKTNAEKTEKAEKGFEEEKNQILQRVDTVTLGLQRLGVRSVQLNTEELIELYYGLYNPTETSKTTGIKVQME